MDELLGQPIGFTYEIVDVPKSRGKEALPGRLKHVSDKSLEEIGMPNCSRRLYLRVCMAERNMFVFFAEETEATNELISASGAQSLTMEDIEGLKAEGLSGRDIIEAQVTAHASFDLKNEYSKVKYRQRKESKYVFLSLGVERACTEASLAFKNRYLSIFTPLPPTIHTIAAHHFTANPARIREMRPDTLAQLLCHANVSPGSRVIVADSTGGLITAGILERLGGLYIYLMR
jgi:hypothetical protein